MVQIRHPLPHLGPLVKRLRHGPFTAVTWVRFPYASPTKKQALRSECLFFCFVPRTRNRTHSRISRAVFFCYVTHSRHRRALAFLRESGSNNSLAVSRRNLVGEASTRTRHQQKENFCLPKVLFLFIQAAGLAYHHRAKRGGYHQPLWGCISSRASVYLPAA